MAMKQTLFIQYNGREIEEKEIVTSIKQSWTDSGNKIRDIKTLDIYLKPEENAVYYVINETESGKVVLSS